MSWPWIMPWNRVESGYWSGILCLVSGFEFKVVFELRGFVEKERGENRRCVRVGEEWRDWCAPLIDGLVGSVNARICENNCSSL